MAAAWPNISVYRGKHSDKASILKNVGHRVRLRRRKKKEGRGAEPAGRPETRARTLREAHGEEEKCRGGKMIFFIERERGKNVLVRISVHVSTRSRFASNFVVDTLAETQKDATGERESRRPNCAARGSVSARPSVGQSAR